MNKKYLLLFSFVVMLTNAIWGQSVTDLLRTANNKILFKNYKEALAGLNKLVTVEKSNELASKVYHLRGRAHAGLKMQKDALPDFNTAIQLDPNNVEAYNYKGLIFLEQEKPEDALISFNTAIEKNVTYADAFLNRSKALFKLNRHQDALEDINKVIKAAPNSVEALLMRASIKRGLNEINGALQDCNKAIDIDENATEAYMMRADIRLALGNPGAGDFLQAAKLGSLQGEYLKKQHYK